MFFRCIKPLLFFLFFIDFAFSQDIKCITDEYHLLHPYKNDSLQKEYLNERILIKSQKNEALGIIKIPIVVHVVHFVEDSAIGVQGNISDEQIISQIKVLNEDYRRKAGTSGFNTNSVGADIEIEFCLASTDPNCKPTNGITRHYSAKKRYDPVTEFNLVASADYWSNRSYLNIWVCSLAGGYLGYAQFPNASGLPGLDSINGSRRTDGLLINSRAFGRNTGSATSGIYNLGRTVTHEIGHWLGLLHTWGNGYCGTDYCNDTPQCEGAYNGNVCRDVFSKCDSVRTRNMTENYLDYSPDACMNIFTQDQKDRMRSVFANAPDRVAILNTRGCEEQIIYKLPFDITMEKGNNFVDGWVNESSIGSNWEYALGLGALNSSNSLVIKNDQFSIGNKPIFSTYGFLDLTKSISPIMLFDMAYPNISETDTLVVSAILGCTKEYFLGSFAGENLITSSKIANNFQPDFNDWKSFMFDLSPLISEKYVKIRFKNISNGKSNLYLDNIRFINTPSNQKSTVFSNPITVNANSLLGKQVQMEVLFRGDPTNIKFQFYDLNGRLVLEKDFPSSIPGSFFINVNSFLQGFYIVKTIVNGDSRSSKIIVYE
jgi:hypothetical protein